MCPTGGVRSAVFAPAASTTVGFAVVPYNKVAYVEVVKYLHEVAKANVHTAKWVGLLAGEPGKRNKGLQQPLQRNQPF